MAKFERKSALSSRQIWLFGLLLIVATVIAYLPAWNGQPIWDDNAHITAPWLRSGHGLVEIWSQLGATQQYYPLVHSVFWIEQKIWGDSVLGYHLVNILLHGFSAVVLLKILLRLQIPGAWLAAGLFALHPVQVESVAWISELKNTLSGFFFFWSILSYLNFDERRNRGSYIASLVLFLLGLMCKTVIAPLPAIILVVLWFKRGRLKPREDVVPLLPFFAVGIGAGLITAWVEHTLVGAQGAVFQMISHGIVSGALFLAVGIVYDRMHTREISAYGGLADRMPIYAFVFMVFTMANVGLPGTSGFIGEFLSLLGTFRANTVAAFFATFGIILSAVYALTLYRRIIFGKLEKPSLATITDMTPREIAIMAPLVILTLVLGIYPKPVFDMTSGAVNAMIAPYQKVIVARENAGETHVLAELQK